MTTRAPRLPLLHLIFFCSGAAGLGYQVAWAKMFSLGLGCEAPAVLAVVSAFLGGMALGARALDRVVSRSANPGGWYAVLELLIGGWGIFSAWLIPLANQLALSLIGLDPAPARHWSVAFAVPFLTLLPATAAMGATLPAMERFVSRLAEQPRWVGGLYGINTLGAVGGILLSAFILAPAWGFRATIGAFATINLLCGSVVLVLARRATATHAEKSAAPTANAFLSPRRLALTVALTGGLGIGYEVVGVRVLAQVLENTVYTFAVVLAVYLSGTALGAAWFQRWGRDRAPQNLLANLLAGLALTVVLGAWAMTQAQPLYDLLRTRLGDAPTAVALAEMLVAAPVLALPTLCMGATFSLLAQSARGESGGVGRTVALNALGGAMAAPLFGVALLSSVGARWMFLVIALGYAALLPRFQRGVAVVIAMTIALGILLPADLRLASFPAGGRLLAYREGVAASVAVTEDADGQRTLRVNHRFQMGGTATVSAERRHAHIPLLLHPAPKTALFLGLGTGITFGASGVHPGLQADGVELLPEVIDVMPQFESENGAPARRPQLRLHVADARRFVRATTQRYDVIVADLFHPAMDGAGALYTTEHFQAIRARLAPGGLFCQWLPLHQLDEEMLRVITRTFLDVFPHTRAWLLRFNVDTPVLGLIGTLEPMRYRAGWLERRFGHPELDEQLAKVTLKDSIQLFGCLVAGPKELAAFAGAAPRNTDDQPVVIYRAPRFAYQKRRPPHKRLFTLLAQPRSDVSELVETAGDAPDKFAKRIADFITARDLYLNGLVREAEGKLPAAIDAYVAGAARSLDFTWGYARCLTIAQVYARTDPVAARTLLQRLADAQPAQTRAKELLEALGKP